MSSLGAHMMTKKLSQIWRKTERKKQKYTKWTESQTKCMNEDAAYQAKQDPTEFCLQQPATIVLLIPYACSDVKTCLFV